jgi:UDP-glucose 4-epimerase
MADKKRVLVTGGAGFIGSHTVVALHEAGYFPVVVDDFRNSRREVVAALRELTDEGVVAHEVDCCDADSMEAVIETAGPLFGAIHFAADKSVSESVREPLKYYENNVGSLVVLLRALAGAEVRNLVFSSSCTVYGEPESQPVTEEFPRQPAESPYGHTKQVCEDIVRAQAKAGVDLAAVLLRYFNPVGAHSSARIGELPLGRPENLVPFITQTAAGWREKLTVFGDDYDTPDGSCIRDYIHVMDLAEAHVRSLDWLAQREGDGLVEVFNVGTGRGVSVLEAVRAFEEASGESLAYEVGARRPGDIVKIWADTSKAEEVLGWKATRGVEDAMADAWRWQQTLEKPAE